ncbi:MAG: MBL fold metallo-hydrolase [Nanoarchaeota archaeon]|nr:MBL fold metallo-hydrolase [Nanoarchaeota archaeon]MBU1028445.1 MBL fold metallo-hydrolase [Nanoarchaeota archaeon]
MIKQITPNIWQLSFKTFSSCVYVVKNLEPILIDTGSKEVESELLKNLKELYIEPEDITSIILTHNHYDHNGNLNLFQNAKIYSFINTKEIEKSFPDFKVLSTPGHSHDSICILYEDVLFSGDTIFDKNHNYIGRTDLPESNPKAMKQSLEKLKNLKYKILCPGHLI